MKGFEILEASEFLFSTYATLKKENGGKQKLGTFWCNFGGFLFVLP